MNKINQTFCEEVCKNLETSQELSSLKKKQIADEFRDCYPYSIKYEKRRDVFIQYLLTEPIGDWRNVRYLERKVASYLKKKGNIGILEMSNIISQSKEKAKILDKLNYISFFITRITMRRRKDYDVECLNWKLSPDKSFILYQKLVENMYLNVVETPKEVFLKLFDDELYSFGKPIQWQGKTVELAYLIFLMFNYELFFHPIYQKIIGDCKIFQTKTGTFLTANSLSTYVNKFRDAENELADLPKNHTIIEQIVDSCNS